MQMTETQLTQIKAQLKRVMQVPDGFYTKKFAGIDIDSIKTQADFEKLPFSSKEDLRSAYPLGLAAVPEERIVRIHSSSGTTGMPVIIPYTQKDVDDWAAMFARCYTTAGMTNRDRIQITPGYGLWTAGIGFQLGAEKMGAMAIPMGPGNTDKQIQMMIDLKSTVLGATSSYGLRNKICLKKGIIGSERWGDKMRQRIKNVFNIELFDIYGLTEVYGPGIGINCPGGDGIHIWDDFIYCEILDPQTGLSVPDGELGEICLTTLVKEGAPLFRFRTHDLARFIPGQCPHCSAKYPRISAIMGRSDDMVKVKGCILFPSTIEEVIKDVPGTSSEYRAEIEHTDGRDQMTVSVEVENGVDRAEAAITLAYHFKERTNMTPLIKVVGIGDLPRSEKKTKRIIDHRFENK